MPEQQVRVRLQKSIESFVAPRIEDLCAEATRLAVREAINEAFAIPKVLEAMFAVIPDSWKHKSPHQALSRKDLVGEWFYEEAMRILGWPNG